jgi:NAD+ synthase
MSSNLRVEMNQVTAWIKETVEKAGAHGVVLGLSGGIDSAVVGALCVEALGSDHVLPVAMPAINTGAPLKDHVVDMFEYLNCDKFILPVSVSVFTESAIRGTHGSQKLRMGNTAARMRMIHLYNLASAYGYLVIGTENLTEKWLGYATKHGDAASDMEPLTSFDKLEVREMATLFDPPIPMSVQERAPSAELWPGQTDEDEIGAKFEDMVAYHRHCEHPIEDRSECPVTDEIRQLLDARVLANMHKSLPKPEFERTCSILSLS